MSEAKACGQKSSTLTTLAIHMPHFKITIKNHPHPHGHKTFKYSYKTVQSEYCMYWI
jgi:hypothetical protein